MTVHLAQKISSPHRLSLVPILLWHSSKNTELYQDNIPYFIILITCLVDKMLTIQEEIRCWEPLESSWFIMRTWIVAHMCTGVMQVLSRLCSKPLPSISALALALLLSHLTTSMQARVISWKQHWPQATTVNTNNGECLKKYFTPKP